MPNDRFILKIETQDEERLQADARIMVVGKEGQKRDKRAIKGRQEGDKRVTRG